MKRMLSLAWGTVLLCNCSGTETTSPGSMTSGGGGVDATAGSGSEHAGQASQGGSRAAAGSGGSSAGTTSGGSKAEGGNGTGGTAGRSAAGTGGVNDCALGVPADSGSGTCHDFTPCGGDVVGKWKIDTCLSPPLSFNVTACVEATNTITITGDTDVRADGTMQSNLHLVSQTTVPASCVAQLGPCGEPGQGVNPLAECAPGANGSCICTEENDALGDPVPYSTSGSVWTIERDGCPEYSYYCRQGDEVWVRSNSDGRTSVLHLTKL